MLTEFKKLILLVVAVSSIVFLQWSRNHGNITVAQAQEDWYSDSSGSYDDYSDYDSGDSGSYNSSDSSGYDNSYDNSSSGGDSSGYYNPFSDSYDDSSYDSYDNNSGNSYDDYYDNSSYGNTDSNSNEIIVLPGDSYDDSSYYNYDDSGDSNYDNSYYDSYNSGDSYDNYSNYDNSSDSTWDYYDDSSYSSYDNYYDNSSSDGDSSGYNDSYSYDEFDDFMSANDPYNYSDASRSERVSELRQNDEAIAEKLGWESFTATETTGNGGEYATKNNGQTVTGRISEREYSALDIPSLDEGQVLVGGASTKVTDQSGQRQGGNIDTYYIADKDDLPDDYILSPASSLTSSDGEYQPVMIVQDKATALSEDLKADQTGAFSYAESVDKIDPKLNNLGIDEIGQSSKLAKEFITVNSNLTSQSSSYNENSGEVLSGFKNYGANLPSSTSQADKEKAAYDYVNGKIKAADSDSTSYDDGHSLAEAISCGQGVCRDKAPALVTALNAAGIPAAQVDAPGHTFVAVLKSDKSDGSVDHYLDPMQYETYLPLQRPSVKPYQLFPVK